jgi:hypothetical protein
VKTFLGRVSRDGLACWRCPATRTTVTRPDHRLDGAAPLQLAPDRRGHAAAPAGDEHALVIETVAAIAAIDIGPRHHCAVSRKLGGRDQPRRAGIKTDGGLDRNFLAGARSDAVNALLCGAGYNLRLILNWLRHLLRALLQLFAVGYIPACSCSLTNRGSQSRPEIRRK